MSENMTKIAIEAVPNQQAANDLMARIFEVTKPGAVFGQPITQGGYTVITAVELTAGIGVGYGGGGGSGSGQAIPEGQESGVGFGGGGGGGGGTLARPVAAIIIGPEGVRVEPIVDVTKIAIAFFTAFGAMWMALSRMRRMTNRGK
jgi:uncharacterized spore protein YtfJ